MRLYSQSMLQDYLDCPRRFYLSYVEELAWPGPQSEPIAAQEEHIDAGMRFHRLVQQYYLGLPPETLARLANTPNLKRWWENFVTSTTRPPRGDSQALYLTEIGLSAPLGAQTRLLARYDLVVIFPAQRAVIVDWKTSLRRPRPDALLQRMQTRLYRFLLVTAGTIWNNGMPIRPEQTEMLYWFAEHPQQPIRLPYSESEYQRDAEYLRQLTEEIAHASTFPLTEDERLCRYCRYRSYCDRGREAGRWEEMDEVEEPERLFDIQLEQIAEIAF